MIACSLSASGASLEKTTFPLAMNVSTSEAKLFEQLLQASHGDPAFAQIDSAKESDVPGHLNAKIAEFLTVRQRQRLAV